MYLPDVMKKLGYNFRFHQEELGWFCVNVVDMDPVMADALKYHGLEGLREELGERLYRPPWGVWTFPCFDIEEPVPARPDIELAVAGKAVATIVVPRDDQPLADFAETWRNGLKERFGAELPVVKDDEATVELLDEGDVVVFGGSRQNRFALDLALRYRTFFIDAEFPGRDGWVVTTHAGFHVSGHNALQTAFDVNRAAEALACMNEAVVEEGGRLILKRVHRVQQGKDFASLFPSWKEFADSLPKRLPRLQGKDVEVPTDDVVALADLLAVGLESGGRDVGTYNVAPIDIAIDCSRYYQLSADERAARLFRELLFRLADHYLKRPGGADYPSDLDFRLGMLVMHFARMEQTGGFSEEERLFFANLLLACVRSVHEYVAKKWPPDMKPTTRHNHQTFPALTLTYSADYFQRFDLPYIDYWHEYAEGVFSGLLWKRTKQCENSRSYEPFVFEHAAFYSLFMGRGLDMFEGDGLKVVVDRQIAGTDNFFRAVDYGDTAIAMAPTDSTSAALLAKDDAGVPRWFANEGVKRRGQHAFSLHQFPGIRIGGDSSYSPPVGDWERVPLDAMFLEETAPGFPPEFALDKLAFRTGWGDDDHYLLIECVGGAASHSHRDVNGIVRLNHLGRHWIVSNGYGRPIGETNVGKSYSSRETGPVDHNTLVLRGGGEIVTDAPMRAHLQLGRNGNLLYTTGALLGYGGVDWFRTVIVAAGDYVLVLDRLRVVEDGLDCGHVEWNCLGSVETVPDGFRLSQAGVLMDVTSGSGWEAEAGVSDRSACWKRVLESGQYPHAEFPPTKLTFRLPSTAKGDCHQLATLLVAHQGTPPFSLAKTEPGRVVVAGPREHGKRVEDGDLTLIPDGDGCEIRFDSIPSTPVALKG